MGINRALTKKKIDFKSLSQTEQRLLEWEMKVEITQMMKLNENALQWSRHFVAEY